ncbi:hypothetical protein ACFPTY_19865 [Halomonas beimenensis]|uniref:hypothetical protein n=1 Tax=Halomonas beimenensis TaxID=475662 RepID=UPI00360C846E
MNSRGHIMEKAHPFEGILPNLERRYRETDSQSMREELARNLSTQPCKDCAAPATAQRPHVFIEERNLPR